MIAMMNLALCSLSEQAVLIDCLLVAGTYDYDWL